MCFILFFVFLFLCESFLPVNFKPLQKIYRQNRDRRRQDKLVEIYVTNADNILLRREKK